MRHNIKIGAKVAFNDLEDATWFKVIDIDGFTLTVIEWGMGENQRPQYIDQGLVKQFINPIHKPINPLTLPPA